MATSGRTPNANLPQWTGTNKPEMKDLNEAFANIDTELGKKLDKQQQQVFDMPVTTGYSIFTNSWYTKNDLGLVNLHISVRHDDANMPNGGPIAVLPVGYRPVKSVEAPAVYTLKSGETGATAYKAAGSVVVAPNGNITAHFVLEKAYVVLAQVAFVAAQQ